MKSWINRIAAVAVLAGYLICFHVTGEYPLGLFGGSIVLGFGIVVLGEPIDGWIGSTTSMGTEPEGYGCIINTLGWFFLLFPAAWWLWVAMLVRI
ncbi:MAG: hypothetical protein JXL80_12635 [Planctomycetes bacterium]|nr:hypothetical protein [Planctomycetota bacterium]